MRVRLRHRQRGPAPAVSDVRGEGMGASGRATERAPMKGSQKPKKVQKKQAQKSLKERRAEKKAASDPRRYDAP